MSASASTGFDDRSGFQKLKTALHRRLVDAIDLSMTPRLDEAEERAQVRALAEHLCARESAEIPAALRDTMVREVLAEIYGLGPLETLAHDPEVSEIVVTGPDSIWVERNGAVEETGARFADAAHLMRLIHRLVGWTGRRIDERNPRVEGRLPDGSQLSVVIAPLAVRGPTLSIRPFRPRLARVEEMVRRRTMAPEMAAFLAAAVRARLNIVVSGGSGAGKTNLLNALCRLVPPTQRIVTIEQTAQLRLAQTNVVALESRASGVDGPQDLALRDLLRDSLSLRPDRIVLGEARGAEVFELLQAMNTGHDGSMMTVHASDASDALARIELMASLADAQLPAPVVRQHIASAVQILVHVARLASGERKVVRIAELSGTHAGGCQIEDIFVHRLSGFAEGERAIGTFYATGHRPAVLSRMAAARVSVPPGLFEPRELGILAEPSGQLARC